MKLERLNELKDEVREDIINALNRDHFHDIYSGLEIYELLIGKIRTITALSMGRYNNE